MPFPSLAQALSLIGASCALISCALPPPGGGTEEGTGANPCGPTVAVVDYVVDGDTVVLESGERVRYLLVDTPETSPPADCFGPEATTFNEQLVEGQEIELEYDVQCFDPYNRLLAYIKVSGVEVNARLVERGYACVLQIPPNGSDRVAEFENLQAIAESEARGMWGACAAPCN